MLRRRVVQDVSDVKLLEELGQAAALVKLLKVAVADGGIVAPVDGEGAKALEAVARLRGESESGEGEGNGEGEDESNEDGALRAPVVSYSYCCFADGS